MAKRIKLNYAIEGTFPGKYPEAGPKSFGQLKLIREGGINDHVTLQMDFWSVGSPTPYVFVKLKPSTLRLLAKNLTRHFKQKDKKKKSQNSLDAKKLNRTFIG